MTRSRMLIGLLAGPALLVAAAGCEEARETGAVRTLTDQGTSTAPASAVLEDRGQALLRVVHAIPGGGPMALQVGDTPAFPDVAFSIVTPYRPVTADADDLRLLDAGTAAGVPSAAIDRNLDEGKHYTVVVMPSEGLDEPPVLRVLDDDLKPLADGRARVRLIHAVPKGPEMSLWVRGSREPLLDGLTYGRNGGWREVVPAAGALELRTEDRPTALASLDDVALEPGRSYTFVVSGRPGGRVEVIRFVDDVLGEGEAEAAGVDQGR